MWDQSDYLSSAPLVIGGSGGSGTRVVARLSRRAGYDLGTDVNAAGDSVHLRMFYLDWINRFVASERRGRRVPPDQIRQMNDDFHRAIARHLAGCSNASTSNGGRWGWKAPRGIFLLPFMHSQFPKMKFVHVIRDGRDIALSQNQSQLRKQGAVLLTRRERWFNSDPLNSILLWQRVNLSAANYGETNLGKNYQLVRFEDICGAPVETTARLFGFLGAEADAEQAAREEISAPNSIGRWRACPRALRAQFERAAATSLHRFGYVD
jgi:hypothetical protein